VADLAVGCLPVTLLLLYRAAGQSLTGIVANDPEEAVDLVSFIDDHGATSRALVAMSSCGARARRARARTHPAAGDVEQHAAADEAVLEGLDAMDRGAPAR
jgi:hypothetical protein